jgi:hypothetical protein
MLEFNSQTTTMAIGIVVILVAIGVSTAIQQPPKPQESQIMTVGPLWNTDSWICTSDKNFMMYGALRGLAGSFLTINISNEGAQSLYALEEGRLESFSIGIEAGNQITITRTGTVTGFLTIETASDAESSCTPV